MGAVLQFIGDWGHALAAVLFAALGIFLLRRRDEAVEPRLLSAALLLTSCWALYVSFGGVNKPLSGMGESIRNAAWLLTLFVMLRRGPVGRATPFMAVGALYAAVAGLIFLQSFTDLIWRQLPLNSDLHHALVTCSLILRMMTAIGSLLLVHHLYIGWPARERGGVSLLLGALAAMWTYDLNLYAICYFAPNRVDELYALRGLLMALLAPVIAVGMRKDMAGRLQLSRTITFKSLSVFAVALYVLVLTAAAILIELIAGPYARVVEIAAVFFAAVTALLLLPSPRLRAFWKVQVAKHFFQHRYDYRTEWMRFGETIGRPGDDAAPLGERVAKAVTEALGGRGLFGVELFIKGDQVWFSEVSPRPHDTGLVTLISQDLSQFALHARAILGLPIPLIRQFGPSASAVILVEGQSTQTAFANLGAALSEPDTALRLFGKPEVNGQRRMGVALARDESIEAARAKATRASKAVVVEL